MLNDHLEEFDSKVIYRGKFNCCVAQSSKHMMRNRRFLGFTSNTAEETFCHILFLCHNSLSTKYLYAVVYKKF